MANVSFKKGDSSFINNIPISDGQILFDTEKKTIHLDNGNNRLNVGGTNKEVYIGTEPPTDEDAVVWINPNEIADGINIEDIIDEVLSDKMPTFEVTDSDEKIKLAEMLDLKDLEDKITSKVNELLTENEVYNTLDLSFSNMGFIANASGIMENENTKFHYEEIDCKKDDKFIISGTYYKLCPIYTFVNGSEYLRYPTTLDINDSSTHDVYDIELTIPNDGVLYVNKVVANQVKVLKCSGKINEFKYLKNITSCEKSIKQLNDSNILFKKKYAVCGDSFTDGEFSNAIDSNNTIEDGKYQGKNKVYGYLIGNRNNMVIQHLALGGRTMGLPSDSATNGFTNSFVNYYKTIDEDVDYITLYFGINDEHHLNGDSGSDGENVNGVIPIGTIDDTTTATFCGAYNTVLEWLLENRPTAKIGIIVTNGITTTTEYREKTIAIAKKHGIPYIDLNGDDRTPSMHRTCNPNISQNVKQILKNKWSVNPSSNTHPNAKAHEYESVLIENFLRSL